MTTTTTPHVVVVGSLDWPSSDDLETATLLCAGDSFLDYELRRISQRTIRHGSSFLQVDGDDDDDDEEENGTTNKDLALTNGKHVKKPAPRSLLGLTHAELEKISYYQILGDIPMHSTADQVKKAYHKACLKYHPDKTGRGEEDEVFLKVKAAFDTLSDVSKRKSYDSSVDFDDRIPKGGEPAKSFFKIYRPVFERNLRFDARYDPERLFQQQQQLQQQQNNNSSSATPMSGKKKGGRKSMEKDKGPPILGDDDTPLDQVHKFYDYWIHFDSWRDFTLAAAKETENDVESADSRYEKRFMAKEIDKKAKAMKREEMARVNLLVERAMAADPRLKREREREKEEKERIAKERKEKEETEKRLEQEAKERLAKEMAIKEASERETKAVAKAEKEKEKKQLRKVRQLLRKMTMTAYQNAEPHEKVWNSLDAMNDDVELLCSRLTVAQMTRLTDAFGGPDAADKPKRSVLVQVEKYASQTKAGVTEEEIEAERLRDEAREAEAEKIRLAKLAKATNPWTRDELSALAKSVKKYPPGGANRWDAIALFVNNLCKPEDPRTKEECIEKYNQLANSAAAVAPLILHKQSSSSVVSESRPEDGSSAWTEEQDKQLQAGLAQFPATMDKNERWALIANGVDGKGKKECVQRFKAIREAIKNK